MSRPELAKQGRRRNSNALPSPYESTSDESERHLEEDCPNSLAQLEFCNIQDKTLAFREEAHGKKPITSFTRRSLKFSHWDRLEPTFSVDCQPL